MCQWHPLQDSRSAPGCFWEDGSAFISKMILWSMVRAELCASAEFHMGRSQKKIKWKELSWFCCSVGVIPSDLQEAEVLLCFW